MITIKFWCIGVLIYDSNTGACAGVFVREY